MSEKIRRTKPVMFHVPAELHAALMDLAAREGESLSTLLRRASRLMIEAAS